LAQLAGRMAAQGSSRMAPILTNAGPGPNVQRVKRIVIAGKTGFIGSALVRALVERGDRVSVLTRDASRRHGLSDAVELVEWQPTEDGEWQRALDGQDAVVQL